MYSMEVTRLIERCRQGDADALGALYKAYAQKMRGVCRRYINDKQTVEDVVHDAFMDDGYRQERGIKMQGPFGCLACCSARRNGWCRTSCC